MNQMLFDSVSYHTRRNCVIISSSMAAVSDRVFCSSNRISPHSHLDNTSPLQLLLRQAQPHRSAAFQFPSLSLQSHNSVSEFLHRPFFDSSPIFGSTYHFSIPGELFGRMFFGALDKCFNWNFSAGRSLVADRKGWFFVDDKGPEVAAVVLGWLGAEPRHLRRYVEWYNVRGIHAVTFVASVMDVLSFNLGKKLEERIERLTRELKSWLSGNDGGRERFLIVHTFSNTGWLVYGAILRNLRDRPDLLNRIKGCVVDSGGDPNLDPKVWAAGFTTALLKKSSSATYPSSEAVGSVQMQSGINGSKMEEKEPSLVETLLLFAFEKLFSYVVKFPDINKRLTHIISVLSKNQPPCPQLYLYSSADKVIPYQAIESFIEDQKRAGKRVFAYNFGSSPHVDHYRTFPDVYASQLDNFLKECLTLVEKR